MRAAETVSPSPGGEGRGEGGLQTKIELHFRFFGNSLSPLWCSAQLARAQVYWNHFLRRAAFSGGLRRAPQRAAGAEGVVSHQSGSLSGGRHQYDGRQRQPAAGAVHAGQRANQDCAH